MHRGLWQVRGGGSKALHLVQGGDQGCGMRVLSLIVFQLQQREAVRCAVRAHMDAFVARRNSRATASLGLSSSSLVMNVL